MKWLSRLHRLGLTLLLLPMFCAAQDISITGRGPVYVLGTNLTWGGKAGSVNNNFIVLSPFSSGSCLFIQNNDTNLHSYTISAWATGSLSSQTYTGNTAQWTQLSLYSNGLTPTTYYNNGYTLASATSYYYIPSAGASALTISISASTGTGTATLFLTTGSNGCLTYSPPAPCPYSVTITVAPSVDTTIAIPIATQSVVICNMSISFVAAPSAVVAGINLNYVQTSCGVSPTVVWKLNTAATMPLYIPVGASDPSIFSSASSGGLKGYIMCISTGAITSNIQANINYGFQ